MLARKAAEGVEDRRGRRQTFADALECIFAEQTIASNFGSCEAPRFECGENIELVPNHRYFAPFECQSVPLREAIIAPSAVACQCSVYGVQIAQFAV